MKIISTINDNFFSENKHTMVLWYVCSQYIGNLCKTRRLCVLSNTKRYHRAMLLYISAKFAYLIDGSCLYEAYMFLHIKLCFLAICLHVISYVTFSSWVYYKVNIGPIYPLELMFTKVAWNIINLAFSWRHYYDVIPWIIIQLSLFYSLKSSLDI